MFLEIPDLLTDAEINELRTIAGATPFIDGRASNPHSKVKNNEFINEPAGFTRSAQILGAALQRNEEFNNWAFPRAFAHPRLTRYSGGGNYGLHADAAFLPLPNAAPLRSDLSCTIFLSPPETYAGGELSVRLGTRTIEVKGPAGSAVVYPSNTLHEVKPVTRGERLVGLTFIESRIPDPHHRELLYELNEVAALEGLQMSWENFTRLQRVQAGLLRIWADG